MCTIKCKLIHYSLKMRFNSSVRGRIGGCGSKCLYQEGYITSAYTRRATSQVPIPGGLHHKCLYQEDYVKDQNSNAY